MSIIRPIIFVIIKNEEIELSLFFNLLLEKYVIKKINIKTNEHIENENVTINQPYFHNNFIKKIAKCKLAI